MKIQYFLLFLGLITTVGALEVSVSPSVLYESTVSTLKLEINNKGGQIIHDIKLISAIPVTYVESYDGWTSSKDDESVTWSQGSIEPNVQNAFFEFEVEAPAVEVDRILPGAVIVDGTLVANYSVRIFADQTENVILAAVKKGAQEVSSTDRVMVLPSEEQYVPVEIAQLDRPSPAPEENKEYVVLPPLEPRAAMEVPTGFVSGSVGKIKTMRWMFLVFAVIVTGIYVYDQRSNKWIELDQLRKKNKAQ